MATNNDSPYLQIRHNLSGLYLVDWKWIHPIVIAFNTLCPVQFYIHWCVALHWTHWGSYFEKWILSVLEVNFLKKLPQLVAFQIFQSSHFSQNFGYQIWFCTRLYMCHLVSMSWQGFFLNLSNLCLCWIFLKLNCGIILTHNGLGPDSI